MKQPHLPLGEEVSSHVDCDESRKRFELTRWKGNPPENARQGLMFDHMDDAPDQTYLFGD